MDDSRPCLVCGRPIGAVIRPGRGGPQPGLCSDECKRVSKKNASRKWALANRHKEAANRQAIREKHPDYFKRFYAKNREKRRREASQWYRANTERALQVQRAYAASHPEQVRALGRKSANKRRAIKKRVFVESVDPLVVFTRDKGKCGICMKRVEPDGRWEIDHIIPISRGGAHAYVNVQLAHRTCNRSKSTTLPAGQPTLFQVVAT